MNFKRLVAQIGSRSALIAYGNGARASHIKELNLRQCREAMKCAVINKRVKKMLQRRIDTLGEELVGKKLADLYSKKTLHLPKLIMLYPASIGTKHETTIEKKLIEVVHARSRVLSSYWRSAPGSELERVMTERLIATATKHEHWIKNLEVSRPGSELRRKSADEIMNWPSWTSRHSYHVWAIAHRCPKDRDSASIRVRIAKRALRESDEAAVLCEMLELVPPKERGLQLQILSKISACDMRSFTRTKYEQAVKERGFTFEEIETTTASG